MNLFSNASIWWNFLPWWKHKRHFFKKKEKKRCLLIEAPIFARVTHTNYLETSLKFFFHGVTMFIGQITESLIWNNWMKPLKNGKQLSIEPNRKTSELEIIKLWWSHNKIHLSLTSVKWSIVSHVQAVQELLFLQRVPH